MSGRKRGRKSEALSSSSVTLTIRQEPVRTPLRVRSKKRSKLNTNSIDTFDIPDSWNSQSVLQYLLDFSNKLPFITGCDMEKVISKLIERYSKESDTVVRAKIILLITNVATSTYVNTISLINCLTTLLKTEGANIVKSQLLKSLLTISQRHMNENEICLRLLEVAFELLDDRHHLVRCQCLTLIGWLSPTNTVCLNANELSGTFRSAPAATSVINTHQIVGRYMQDRDSRVRTCALQSLLILHNRGIKLDVANYDKAVQAIKDDYEPVRINAIRMIWAICLEYPESSSKSLITGEVTRMVDEGFIKICGMMTDLSMRVRVEAAMLMGTFQQVSFKFLEQTLDKKIMSHLQKRKSDHEKKIERVRAGESAVGWSKEKVWSKEAPKPELTADDVNLIDSGACGAFVHGLEDEFMEVRTATVESMCQLGQRYEAFAYLLTDFIVDMLNDEIESVRLTAIHCLRKLSCKIILRSDQLNIILDLLKDCSTEIRQTLRILLRSLRLTTVGQLQFTVQALLKNLNQYREDQLSIWECLKDLGSDHGYLVMSFMTDLLSLHPYFATSEADISDPSYIGIAIFIFSASVSYPLLMNYFPQFLFKHYCYLKDKYPDLVPLLKFGSRSNDLRTSAIEHNAQHFLKVTMAKMNAVPSAKKGRDTLQHLLRDLSRIQELDKKLAGTAECLSLYIRCQLLWTQVKEDQVWKNADQLASRIEPSCWSATLQILEYSYRMENLFTGLNMNKIVILRQLRTMAHAVLLLLLIRIRLGATIGKRSINCYIEEIRSLERPMQFFKERLLGLESFLSSMGVPVNIVIQSLLAICMKSKEFGLPATVSRMDDIIELSEIALRLQNLSHRIASVIFEFDVPHFGDFSYLMNGNEIRTNSDTVIQRVMAVINEPKPRTDNVCRFVAGLPISISVDIHLDNVSDLSTIKLQATFPDRQSQIFTPKITDFYRFGENGYRLQTKIVISHCAWSDVGYIEICPVITYPVDILEKQLADWKSFLQDKVYYDSESNVAHRNTKSQLNGILELCQSAFIPVHPKRKFHHS